MSFVDMSLVTRSVYDAIAETTVTIQDVILQSPLENLAIAPSRIALAKLVATKSLPSSSQTASGASGPHGERGGSTCSGRTSGAEIAGGGSGFRVLQRNTTQFDTGIQQRDALIDYIRAGAPCGSVGICGMNNACPNLAPFTTTTPATDGGVADGGQIFLAVVSDSQWAVFCDRFGLPELAADARLATNNQRVQARNWLIPLLRGKLQHLGVDALAQAFESAGLPFALWARSPWLLLVGWSTFYVLAYAGMFLAINPGRVLGELQGALLNAQLDRLEAQTRP